MKYPYPRHDSNYRSSVNTEGNADNVQYFQDKLSASDEALATFIGIGLGGLVTIATSWICYKLFYRKTK